MKSSKHLPWIACIGIVILFLVPYSIVNHLSLHRFVIPFMFGEQHIPFLPWTFLIYISAFVQGVIIIRLTPRSFLPRALILASVMVFVAIIIFLLFPIEYPRALYPTTDSLATFFRKSDAAGNCFPSLHVAMAVLLSGWYSTFNKSTIRKIGMWLWTVAIIISVLTTKQHYAIDVIGGIILAVPFILLLRTRFINHLLS